jgi:hypothetical protein
MRDKSAIFRVPYELIQWIRGEMKMPFQSAEAPMAGYKSLQIAPSPSCFFERSSKASLLS